MVLLTGHLAAVYLLVVVAIGAALPPAPAIKVSLTFVAAVLVALTLGPLWTALSRRLPPSAEDRLNRLASRHVEWDEVGAALEKLCRLVTEAVGADSTTVTVQLGMGVSLRRRIPDASGGEPVTHHVGGRDLAGGTPIRRALRRGPRQLGELLVTLPPDRRLSPVEDRLLADAADHAALLVDVSRMDRSLQVVVARAQERYEQLLHSRTRIATVMEEERRRVERDIHDGAQQHLVALAVNLGLLRVLLDRDPARALARTAAIQDACAAAIETLETLSLGLYPSQLVERGAIAALGTAAASSPVPVIIVAPDPDQRWAPEVERTMYFGCIEALQNALKHGEADRIVLTVRPEPHEVIVTVTDDGRGFDPTTRSFGSGMTNLRDRVESVGGTLTVRAAPGRGTSVTAHIPAPAPQAALAGSG